MKTWFKFYGQEFLSDPKMLSLSPIDKALWLTLLCLASSSAEEGTIRYITEQKIMDLAGLDRTREEWDESVNFLQRFEKLKMIKFDNEDNEIVIIVINYKKRQEKVLTGYERVKNYRERTKITEKLASNDNEMITHDNAGDNARIEKNRIDIYKTNGNASPVVKTFQEAKNVILEKLSFPKSGISNAWQEKAFRYADNLKIKLDNDLKSRWLKIFKESSSNGQKAKNLEQAHSYLVDYFPFQSLGAREKVMYFFKLYNDGVQKQAFQNGFISIKALILGVLCTSLVLITPVLAKSPEQEKTVIEVKYSIKSQYITDQVSNVTTRSEESDIPLNLNKGADARPTPSSLLTTELKSEVERLICQYFGQDCAVATAIAKAESGLRCKAVGDEHLEPHSYGVFQIRGLSGRPSPDQLLDCETNISWAYTMYKTQGFYPWSVYTNGKYLKFLSQKEVTNE